mmetsp:Transcript_10919/g.45412  ORF Transcript_10919/g.45412 Transcript_10919/m.45412 type:complete len:216 (-) Transcript_10919:479-1126(-)
MTSVSQVVTLPETISYEVLAHGNNITYFRCTQANCGTLRAPFDEGSLLIEGDLSELHLHSPSESSLFSLHTSMELQFFFSSGERIVGIFSVLYRSLAAQGNEALGLLVEDGIRASETTDTVTGTVSTSSLYDPDSSFFVYSGSLTIPPCTEGVSWFLQRDILEVGGDQVESWYEFVGYPGNSRPTQDLRGRTQTLFTSSTDEAGNTPEPDLVPET